MGGWGCAWRQPGGWGGALSVCRAEGAGKGGKGGEAHGPLTLSRALRLAAASSRRLAAAEAAAAAAAVLGEPVVAAAVAAG